MILLRKSESAVSEVRLAIKESKTKFCLSEYDLEQVGALLARDDHISFDDRNTFPSRVKTYMIPES